MQLLGCTLQWIGGNVTVDGASRVPMSRQDNHQNSVPVRSGTVWVPDLDTDSNDLLNGRDTDTSYSSPAEQWAYMLTGSSTSMGLADGQSSPSVNTDALPAYNLAGPSATCATSILHFSQCRNSYNLCFQVPGKSPWKPIFE